MSRPGSKTRWNTLKKGDHAPRRRQRDLLRAQATITRERVTLGGESVDYALRRSHRRRSIALLIDDRGLRVAAPHGAGADAIEGMLKKHETWVLRKLRERLAQRGPSLQWVTGEAIMFLGTPLTLDIVPGAGQPAVHEDRLMAGADLPALAERVGAWLKSEALACFRTRVAHFHPLLGVGAPEVRLSNARTRWGSCHASGRVSLNWRLVQIPLRLIDYVVVHELAHLREMNHSHRFWTIVYEMLPDYAARRKELLTESGAYLRV